MSEPHIGGVVFVDGVHYATVEDENGDAHADMNQPLTFAEDGFYYPRQENDPLHNEKYGTRSLTELIPGSEDE